MKYIDSGTFKTVQQHSCFFSKEEIIYLAKKNKNLHPAGEPIVKNLDYCRIRYSLLKF